MSAKVITRRANSGDLDQLLDIETQCFETDRLSRRSFSRFIKTGSHELIVAAEDKHILGYVLLLYRNGTPLARMYSLAVSPQAQGKGISSKLIDAAEAGAQKNHCFFMRLEVNVNNSTAIAIYEKYRYKPIGTIKAYYDNGDDAWRMEKRLHKSTVKKSQTKPYYQQTTEFTCGPSSLMMGIKTLKPAYKMTRREEMQIWRESTTIFMTSGHGGCSPHGLALSAWHRGLKPTIYINQKEAPFLDGVRDEQKKSVIQLVHKDFLSQIKETGIKLKIDTLEGRRLDDVLNTGKPILALISTWRFNRNKAPHWVYVTEADENFVYINDSDQFDNPHETPTDYMHVPISRKVFHDMARFGQKRLRCFVVLGGET